LLLVNPLFFAYSVSLPIRFKIGSKFKPDPLVNEMEANFRAGFVALVGRPNVGKSTLLNSLLGQKISITADKPQTTRNQIRGILTEDRFQAILVDTPGIHLPKNELHKRIVGYAHKSISESDLVFYLCEPLLLHQDPSNGDKAIVERLAGLEKKAYLLLNKIDLYSPAEVMRSLEVYNQLFPFAETFAISAQTKRGLEGLTELLAKALPVSPPLFELDQVTDLPEKVLCGEFIREQIHRRLHQEVPFGVAVVVDKFQEEGVRVKIWATVFVERESHKKILIGKAGEMLKTIGTGARRRIETLVGSKVFLDLHVKVAQGWVDNRSRLAEFGYKEE